MKIRRTAVLVAIAALIAASIAAVGPANAAAGSAALKLDETRQQHLGQLLGADLQLDSHRQDVRLPAGQPGVRSAVWTGHLVRRCSDRSRSSEELRRAELLRLVRNRLQHAQRGSVRLGRDLRHHPGIQQRWHQGRGVQNQPGFAHLVVVARPERARRPAPRAEPASLERLHDQPARVPSARAPD